MRRRLNNAETPLESLCGGGDQSWVEKNLYEAASMQRRHNGSINANANLRGAHLCRRRKF